MRKLLRADLFCLRRNRVLWLCMAAAFVISAIFLLRLSTDNENMRILDDAFLQLLPFLSILHAAFIGLFLGVEYQDGTMRNKLVVGHSRRAVYGAYLITGTVGCFAILLAWAASVVIGVVRFGWFVAPAGTLPLEVMPTAMQKVVSFFPLTQGLTMMKNAFLGIGMGNVLVPVCVMLGLTALCTALAVRFFRWE